MLAPIALQPDGVVSQVLIASTYPDEVAAAARWARANPHLRGDTALRAVQNEPWDPAVKALLAFPELLIRMDESPQWLRDLGEAFVQQEAHVMDTVQALRRRAQATGKLASHGPVPRLPAGRGDRGAAAHPDRLRALLRPVRRVRAVVVAALPPGVLAPVGAAPGVRRARLLLQQARLAPPPCPRRASPGSRPAPSWPSCGSREVAAAEARHREAARARAGIAAQADRAKRAALAQRPDFT